MTQFKYCKALFKGSDVFCNVKFYGNTINYWSRATRLYTPLCPSVGLFVGRSVGRSIGQSVSRSIGRSIRRSVGKMRTYSLSTCRRWPLTSLYYANDVGDSSLSTMLQIYLQPFSIFVIDQKDAGNPLLQVYAQLCYVKMHVFRSYYYEK